MKDIAFRTIMIKGEAGGTISRIEKTGTSGIVDTYTIYMNDGSTTTFEVTNGNGIASIEKTSTSGLVDTYTITYEDGDTDTFEVTNGEDAPSYEVPTGTVVYFDSIDPVPDGYEASDPIPDLSVYGGQINDPDNTIDLNTLNTANKNYWVNLARASNTPAGSGYGVLEVVKFSADSLSCLQRFTKFGNNTDSTRGDVYIRFYTNNQWYNWNKITSVIT